MRFKLRKPCKDCPFRNDIRPFIHPERAAEIARGVLEEDLTFTCHKTISGENTDEDEYAYEEDPTAEVSYVPGPQDQMCAGALVLIQKTGSSNQMVQLAERFGMWDPSKLDMDSPVYESARDMVEAHERQDALEREAARRNRV